MNEIKVVYIIDNLNIGGAQTHILRLVEGLAKHNFSINLVCLGKDAGSLKLNNISIEHLRMDCVWKSAFWKDFVLLIKRLKTIKPNIVHTYLNTSNVFGVLAAKIAGVPIIISSRRDMGHFRSKFIACLEAITGRLSNKIVSVSEAVTQNTITQEKQNHNKVVSIYNGIDENVFVTLSPKQDISYYNIALVASMDRKEKGHSYFIEAAQIVLKKRKDVRFVLMGDGPLKNGLESHINSAGLKDYFCFKGRVENVNEELNLIDILVVPSESEGCSNALLEAMAMSIPVIATAVEGNLELIQNGKSGYLVPAKDPPAIAKKIEELLDFPRIRENMGKAARKRVEERFTLSEMVKTYKELYTNLAQKKTFKVGYVVSLFPCWSETFILNELIELKKRGVEITIFSIRRDFEKFTQEKTKPFIKDVYYINAILIIKAIFLWLIKKPIILLSLLGLVITKKHTNLKSLFKNLWCIFVGCRFAEIANKENLSHIHAHFATYPALVAMAISRLTNIQFSFTAHAHDIFLDKTFLRELAQETKEIVVISEYNKNYITEYCKDGVVSKIRVIHCGVDITDFTPVTRKQTSREKIILSIGRLTEMKGFEYLIRACKKIPSETSFKCHIVGDGPLRSKLTKLTEYSGLNNRVVFEGILDHNKINNLLNKADIFVLPSIWSDKDGQDGIPVVLMEAMAKGVPVIASRISGIPELIEDRKTGLLVEPKDETALSNLISELITNSYLCEELAVNGRRKIEEDFNIKKSADKLAHVFKKRVKILFVIWSLEKGGAERFLTSLVKALDRNNIDPVVCCLNWKGKWAQEVEDAGIKVVALNKRNGLDIKALFKLIKLMRKEKFDIVNTQLWESDGLGRVAAILAGVPIIISTAQNVDIWKRWHHRIIDKILACKTDKIIAVSNAVNDYYNHVVGIPKDKIAVIPNAIDLGRFNNLGSLEKLQQELNLSRHDYIFSCIGRLTEQKGQRYLFEAIAMVKDQYPNIKTLIIGDGEDKKKLQKLSKELGITDSLRFLGYREDIPQLLSITDVLVLPSLYEGLPLCILEAMAIGKPVIATNVGGINEIIVDQENGFIVSPGNAKEIALAIKKFIIMPDKGKEMGKKGKSRVSRDFSIQSVAKKTEELFYSLISSSR